MATRRPIRTLDDLRGRRAVVLGLARSGVAAARLLSDAGATVAVYDRRPAAELSDAVAALGGRPLRLALGVPQEEARALLSAADLLVTSPSISPRFPTTDAWLREALAVAVARGTELVSEVDLFLRLARARVLAVTGTKGKTTTAALLGRILEQGRVPHVLGGNIGAPLVEQATRLTERDWAVLELSELQLPTISRGASVAIYTNISADHLDRHGTEEAYRSVKARLAELSLVEGGIVVLNADDPGCRELAGRLGEGRIAWYGFGDRSLAATVEDGMLLLDGQPLISVDEIRLPGRHMQSNVLAAALGARLVGVAPDEIAAGIRSFGGVPHRLEPIAELGGIRFVNDSQATIPIAAIVALEAFDAPIVLIAGGKDKGLDYALFADAIAGRCRAAVLIGETADALERLIAGRVPVSRAGSIDDAVATAIAHAVPGDVVLLAPAAASFDMFTDYAARGDAFRAAVASRGGGA